MAASSSPPALGLGLDAGGTQTRWALADAGGSVLAQGAAAGFTALQMANSEGVAALAGVLRDIAGQVQAQGWARRVCAGLTGFDGDDAAPLAQQMAQAFSVAPVQVRLMSDIELACRAAFSPGTGCLVYAGTGSVAGFVDLQGQLHRAGGRGGLIDDGGSGYWIAREALRHIWRAEDERPGAWRESALAQRLFDALGGADWPATRAFVYGASRGQLGALAVAVADAADVDPVAMNILRGAGSELARLARALILRCGPRTVALAGRVFQLHPAVEQALRDALPQHTVQPPRDLQVHLMAARMAAGG